MIVELHQTIQTVEIYDGDEIEGIVEIYGSGSSTNLIWNEVPAGTMNGVNREFTLASAPSHVLLSLNGLVLKPVDDYSISGSTITFDVAAVLPESGDNLLATYTY